jgi:hypothetical protein
MMQHFKALRTRTRFAISIILAIVIVNFGCGANRNDIKKEADFGVNIVATDFMVTGKGTDEGISLQFNNIPRETDCLVVEIMDITSNYQTYASIRGDELEKIKKTQTLSCPFAQDGHEYKIDISIATNFGNMEYQYPITNSTNPVATGGIHLINEPSLYFDNKNYIATLSEQPIFSEEVIFDKYNKFSYSLTVITDKGTHGISGHSNELITDFEFPDYGINQLKERGATGDCPVIVSANCNLVYKNIHWSIVVAQFECNISI